jgi:tetratricopeptide (TPR) repeat protein
VKASNLIQELSQAFFNIVDSAEEFDLLALKADNLKRLGDIAFRRNQLDESESFYLRSLKLYEKMGDEKGMADLYNDLGTISCCRGDWPHAVSLLERCLDVADQISARPILGKAYNTLGLAHIIQEKYSQALSYLREALNQFEHIEDNRGIAEVLNNLGLCYGRQRMPLKAGDYYERAIRHANKAGDAFMTAICYMQRAELCNQISDYRVARFYCNHALELFQTMGGLHKTGSNASPYRNTGVHLTSKDYLKKAIAICGEIENQVFDTEALVNDLCEKNSGPTGG